MYGVSSTLQCSRKVNVIVAPSMPIDAETKSGLFAGELVLSSPANWKPVRLLVSSSANWNLHFAGGWRTGGSSSPNWFQFAGGLVLSSPANWNLQFAVAGELVLNGGFGCRRKARRKALVDAEIMREGIFCLPTGLELGKAPGKVVLVDLLGVGWDGMSSRLGKPNRNLEAIVIGDLLHKAVDLVLRRGKRSAPSHGALHELGLDLHIHKLPLELVHRLGHLLEIPGVEGGLERFDDVAH
nr:hypothetical protein RchiOBHm_Chr2g0142291 [Ipomoea batatas]